MSKLTLWLIWTAINLLLLWVAVTIPYDEAGTWIMIFALIMLAGSVPVMFGVKWMLGILWGGGLILQMSGEYDIHPFLWALLGIVTMLVFWRQTLSFCVGFMGGWYIGKKLKGD